MTLTPAFNPIKEAPPQDQSTMELSYFPQLRHYLWCQLERQVLLAKVFSALVLAVACAGLFSQSACLAESDKAVKKFQITPDICFSKVGDYSCRGDLYTPTTPSESLMPAVVVIHGGGWKTGDRLDAACVEVSGELASRQIVAFSVDYRLVSDGGYFPNDVQDVWRAADYLRKNAAKYHIDVNRMGVFGASSGAHLGLLAAYAPDKIGLTEAADQVHIFKAVVAYCPPADLMKLKSSWALAYLNDLPEDNPDLAKRASPVTYVKTAVPTLIIQGEEDQIVSPEQGKELGARLKAAGIETELIMLPNADHFFCFKHDADHDLALAKCLRFLQNHLQAATSASASPASRLVTPAGGEPTRPASIPN